MGNQVMAFKRTKSMLKVLLACVVTGGWASVPAWGQSALPGASPAGARAISAEAMLADQLIIHARRALQEGVRPDTLVRCQILMDEALKLNPADADAWLLRRELARLQGERGMEFRALVQYARLRPDDDAAQFDMVMLSVEQNQTVEGRVADLERFLGTSAAGLLSNAARSRLMSTLGQTYRELAKESEASQWITRALSQDRSNAHAAGLSYEHAVSHGADAVTRGEALLAVLTANPLDVGARRLLADLLLGEGAYAQASVQYRIAGASGGGHGDARFMENWAITLAATGDTGEALKILDQIEARAFEPGPSDPALMSMPLDLDMVRHAVLSQVGDVARARATYRRLREGYLRRVADGDERAAVELTWLTAMYGPTITEGMEQAITEYAQTNPGDVLAQRTLGWIHLRRHRLEEAGKVFAPLAEHDAFSMYGLALSTGSERAEMREGYLRQTVRMSPGSVEGMLASRDLLAAGGVANPSADGQKLLSRMQQAPSSVIEPDWAGTPWLAMGVQVMAGTYDYLEPLSATVKLRNTTDMTFGLGSNATVPTRLFLYLTPWQAGQPTASLPPQVVDLRRRLTIGPRQMIEVPVRLDRAVTGELLAYHPEQNFGLTVTAILDPIPTGDGTVVTGPLGIFDVVRAVDRRGAPLTDLGVDQWLLEASSTPDAARRLRRLAQLARMLNHMPEPLEGRMDRAVALLNGTFANLDRVSQAWVVLFLPPTAEVDRRLPAVHELSQRSDDVLLRVAYLATQVMHGDSPALNAALRDSPPDVQRFAEALRDAFKAVE